MDENMMTKNFDFKVVQKNGDTIVFSGVEKNEGQPILEHFKKQKVKIQIVKEDLNPNQDDYDGDDDDEEDELVDNSYEKESFINDKEGLEEEDEDLDDDYNPEKDKKKLKRKK